MVLAEVAQPRWSCVVVAWSLEDTWSWSAVIGVVAAAGAPVTQCVGNGHRQVEVASCPVRWAYRQKAEAAIPGAV
jgi:hypothetical protein